MCTQKEQNLRLYYKIQRVLLLIFIAELHKSGTVKDTSIQNYRLKNLIEIHQFISQTDRKILKINGQARLPCSEIMLYTFHKHRIKSTITLCEGAAAQIVYTEINGITFVFYRAKKLKIQKRRKTCLEFLRPDLITP